jgi:leucine dehydrogenase
VLFETLEEVGLRKLVVVRDVPSGLRALIAIHDTTLGPAAGGVRTCGYPDEWAALRDAAALAETMTYKCALAGLPCGGGKAVVLEDPAMDRERAFEMLGAAVESLGGLFRTAGDLGTHESDLRAMERRTRFVQLDAQGLDLEGATAHGVMLALREGAAAMGADDVHGLAVLVQGVGAIGFAVARALAEAGARLSVSDLDGARAAEVAGVLGARIVDPEDALATPCDVFAPCATSGVLDREAAEKLPCRLVCGGANNPLADDAVAEVLRARGVLYVPDFVANAGAVIEGIGSALMGLSDRTALVDRIAETTRIVLGTAAARGVSPLVVARDLARERIEDAMPKWRRSR